MYARLFLVVGVFASGCIGSGDAMGFTGIQHGVIYDSAQDVASVRANVSAMGFEIVEESPRGIVTAERDGVSIETVGLPGDPWAFRARIAARFETHDYATLNERANKSAQAQKPAFESIVADFEGRIGLQHRNGSYEWKSLTWVE